MLCSQPMQENPRLSRTGARGPLFGSLALMVGITGGLFVVCAVPAVVGNQPPPNPTPAPVPPSPLPSRTPVPLAIPPAVQSPQLQEGGREDAAKLDSIKSQILRSLQEPERTPQSGDPILDGILDAARQRGSILEHFPETTGPDLDRGQSQAAAAADTDDFSAHVAEQLLKSARLLARLPKEPDGSPAESRAELIARLRAEAARCLRSFDKSPVPTTEP